jgi:hypothetical protein
MGALVEPEMERVMDGRLPTARGLGGSVRTGRQFQVDILILKRIKYSDICSPVCQLGS